MIALSAKRGAAGWMAGFRFPVGTRDFCLFHSVQTGSEAYPAHYPKGTRALSAEIKRSGLN
jgi:hypothetical protein